MIQTPNEIHEKLAILLRSGVVDTVDWNDLHETARDWYRYQSYWIITNRKEIVGLLNAIPDQAV